MRLIDIWKPDNVNAISDPLSNLDIKGITCDSRAVQQGYIFAALPGSAVDGRDYVIDAIDNGAIAIIDIDDGRPPLTVDVPVIRDVDPRRRYARLAAAFYGVQPAHIGAVTGTNGKTSVAWFSRQLINFAGLSAASAGTLGILATDASGAALVDVPGGLTTPDPAILHRDLKAVAGHGVDHLVIEASSHGLDQRRLDGLRIRAAAFTNFSRDHLDYHGTEDAYLTAKLRLFDNLVIEGGIAVVNMDGRFADAFAGAAQRRGLEVVRVGRDESCAYRIDSVDAVPGGLDIQVSVGEELVHCRLPLIGAFQAENALVALALSTSLGVEVGDMLAGLPQLQAAPGRMQHCGDHPSGAGVYVDYAHTPDALGTMLQAIRPHASGRVHVVFGCGGDRDPGKRPEMARACAENADVVILTDDNPRTEDPAKIRAEAKIGAPGAREIGDRRIAIQDAIAGLSSGDVLVVAGKGHEPGQIVGATVLPFDDADEVRTALAEFRE